MKRGQVAALIAGATLGLAGVTLAVVVSRAEGREAARRMLDRTAPVADQVRKAGERAAKVAVAQYQVSAPKAVEAFNTVLAQAPQAAGTLRERLPLAVKSEPTGVRA